MNWIRCVCLFVSRKNCVQSSWLQLLLTHKTFEVQRWWQNHLLTLSLSFPPAKRGDDGSSFSEDQLCAFILELHFAGTDTTANTLLTAFLYLMNYPQIQGMSTCHLSLSPLFSHARGVALLNILVTLYFCHVDNRTRLHVMGYCCKQSERFTLSFWISWHSSGSQKSYIVLSCLTFCLPLFMLSLCLYCSERCQQEIDKVLDGKDQVTFADRHQMPYVQV